MLAQGCRGAHRESYPVALGAAKRKETAICQCAQIQERWGEKGGGTGARLSKNFRPLPPVPSPDSPHPSRKSWAGATHIPSRTRCRPETLPAHRYTPARPPALKLPPNPSRPLLFSLQTSAALELASFDRSLCSIPSTCSRPHVGQLKLWLARGRGQGRPRSSPASSSLSENNGSCPCVPIRGKKGDGEGKGDEKIAREEQSEAGRQRSEAEN